MSLILIEKRKPELVFFGLEILSALVNGPREPQLLPHLRMLNMRALSDEEVVFDANEFLTVVVEFASQRKGILAHLAIHKVIDEVVTEKLIENDNNLP